MRLTDCFMELIAYVAYFLRTAATKQPTFDKINADIQRLISKNQDYGTFSQEDYDLARFAIFAWIDEAILSSSWSEKNQWQGALLQRSYYQTTDAGEDFFKRLNTLGPHQRDVREVYYLCLSIGFTGRYCNEGDDYLLEQLKTSNLKLLAGSSMGVPSLERELFPEGYPNEVIDKKERKGFSIFTFFCLGAPILLYSALFLIYRFILSNIGENF